LTDVTKIVEIDNCIDENLIKAIYNSEFWEAIAPTQKMEAKFIAPNVLYSKIYDKVNVINIEMEGELVLSDLGVQEGKGTLIELNIRNNKDVKKLEGRLRIKALSPNKTKVGLFIDSIVFNSDFLNLFGGAADLTLQMKITEMMRNLERLCKEGKLEEFV
jgi:hypothetical protein